MLNKIICGGQTGADRAALDVAIKMGIPHGGWIPKGRRPEEGTLADKYNLKEMPSESYPARTEQNVIDSDGTLIIFRGKLTGGTDYTRKMTLKHKKQLLGIDLNQTNHYDAASLIAAWIRLQRVEVLNVAGPRASEDPAIYDDVQKILENAIQILRAEERKSEPESRQSEPSGLPKTVQEAVDRLVSEMPLKDKTSLANMAEADLIKLHFSLGLYVRNRFFYAKNEILLESCRYVAQDKYLHWSQAPMLIIKELWKTLRETHKLRIVK
ncbi:MAG: putative molybdenum carrier protein [Desulfobacterales bacterium]|nr:MAG: putative molybdenum carrier protein [Desulfobacterales bacterium]